MKRNTTVARVTEADAGLERIKHLVEQLAPAPVNSPQHRTLSAAIRIEADAYRKSLDTEQATATHDAKPQPAVGRGSLNRTDPRPPSQDSQPQPLRASALNTRRCMWNKNERKGKGSGEGQGQASCRHADTQRRFEG